MTTCKKCGYYSPYKQIDRNQVEKWIQVGRVHCCHPEFAHPVAIIKNEDGSRVWNGYQKLNWIITEDRYPRYVCCRWIGYTMRHLLFSITLLTILVAAVSQQQCYIIKRIL